jgi:predicted dehydrogenase
MKTNVLIIGSGGRVRNNFIPAFHCLKDKHNIIGLYSPTKANREAVCDKWHIPAIEALESVNFEMVDIVVISITTDYVPDVLKQIHHLCKGKTLIVDTPVFEYIKDFRATLYLLSFSKVIVTEDYLNYPQFGVMREVIQSRVLGEIKNITLSHTGYRHHALAVIRSFVGLKKVWSIKHNSKNTTRLSFPGGISATITEPYQRLDGWVKIEGSKGTLLYDPKEGYTGQIDDSWLILKENICQNTIATFELNGFVIPEARQPKYFAQLKQLKIEDTSNFNTFKTCGLIDVFESIYIDNDARPYTWQQALYDTALSKFIWKVKRLPRWFNKAVPSFWIYQLFTFAFFKNT